MTVGALNVSFSDGSDPYLHRARRMLAASLCCSLAVFIGGLAGHNHAAAALLAAAFAFAAGMMVAVGQVGDGHWHGYAGHVCGVFRPADDSEAGAGGRTARAGGRPATDGFLAGALAVAPVRAGASRAGRALFGTGPSRRRARPATEAPPASAESTEAQAALASLGGDHSVPAERHLALLSQAERMRLALLTLARLRNRLEREHPGDAAAARLDEALALSSGQLTAIAESLLSGSPAAVSDQLSPSPPTCTETRSGSWKHSPGNCARPRNWPRMPLPPAARSSKHARRSGPGGCASPARSRRCAPISTWNQPRSGTQFAWRRAWLLGDVVAARSTRAAGIGSP